MSIVNIDNDDLKLERRLLTGTKCRNESKMPCQLWQAKRVPAWSSGLKASPVALRISTRASATWLAFGHGSANFTALTGPHI